MTTIDSITPSSVFTQRDNWSTYEADLHFTGRLVGGAPSDPKLVEGWMAKNLGLTDEDAIKAYTRKHLAEVQGLDPADMTDEAIDAALEAAAAEKKAQVFKRTAEGMPYIEGRHVKAMIKEATSISYPRGENKFGSYRNTKGVVTGGKEPRAYVAERVFVPERPIIVGTDVDGVELAVGHLKDWRGETRSTIGYFEYVERPEITLTITVLDDCLDPEQWARIWTVAELNGLGARRSQGAGQFVVTRWERVA